MEFAIIAIVIVIIAAVLFFYSGTSKEINKDTLAVNMEEPEPDIIAPPKPPANVPPPKPLNEPTVGYQIVAARSKPAELRTEEEQEIVEKYEKYPPYTWEHTMEYYIQRYSPEYRTKMIDLVNRYMAGEINYHDFLIEFNKIHTEALRNHAFAL